MLPGYVCVAPVIQPGGAAAPTGGAVITTNVPTLATLVIFPYRNDEAVPARVEEGGTASIIRVASADDGSVSVPPGRWRDGGGTLCRWYNELEPELPGTTPTE